MSAYDDYADFKQYPTYYSHYSLTKSGQPILVDSQLTLNRQRRRELFIRENQPAWWVKGQQYRYVRKSMYISHYELAKCLGLSPSVILAFEEGKPIQRPHFVEGAYRAALTSIFYKYKHCYSSHTSCPKDSALTFTLIELLGNIYCEKEITLKNLQELVDTFNFRIKFQDEGWIEILDESGTFLFLVQCKEAV